MATYGRKIFIALFASFMLILSSIDHQVACSKNEDEYLLLEQKKALFEFFKVVKASKDVNWDMKKPVCEWKGIECDPSKKKFITWLKLPGKSLIGEIPENTIGNIKSLVKLSLRSNGLTGPIPSDFIKLENLVQFSLQNNSFSGQLPDLNLKHINKDQFSVSYNNLDGYIPHSLSSLKKSSFTQNVKLCGPPLARPCPFPIPTPPPTPPPTASPENKNKNKLPTGAIVGIAIGSPLLFLFLLSCLRKDVNMQPHNTQAPIRPQTSSSSKDKFMEGERSKLVFFEDGIYSFGVEDLLRASAEILGKGRIGTTYKVLMNEGTVVVVKRLKDVVMTKKDDFESRMEVLGKMKNENLVPLRAYHCSEVEKLLVYDYFPAGSVHDLLHGSRGSGQIPLDWEERMGIALSAAKGLAYLHVSGKLVHGNFKSSNILLRQETNKEAFVSDYGLNILSERSNSPTVTMKSDAYNFGIFLLELLTRKVPNQTSSGEEGFDLPRLVQSVPQEEWKTKIFDTELMSQQNRNVEEEMVRLLEIAMSCVSFVPNQQPTMGEVVRMLKDMNRDTLSIVTQ